MCAYSNLDGPSKISPASTGVWRVKKKQKISDRNKGNKKEDRKSGEEKEPEEFRETVKDKVKSIDDTEEHGVYSSEGKKKSTVRKVDVKI